MYSNEHTLQDLLKQAFHRLDMDDTANEIDVKYAYRQVAGNAGVARRVVDETRRVDKVDKSHTGAQCGEKDSAIHKRGYGHEWQTMMYE